MTTYNQHLASKLIDYLVEKEIINLDALDRPEQYLTNVFNDIVGILEG